MKDSDYYRRVKIAEINSEKSAIDAVLAYKVDISYYVGRVIPRVFGDRWEKLFIRIQEKLIADYPGQFDSLIALAMRSYIYSIVSASSFMLSLYNDVGGPRNETEARFLTPQGYADSEGWAYTLFNGVCALINKPQVLLSQTKLKQFPEDSALLNAMGMVWFIDAAKLRGVDESMAMNFFFEASDALSIAGGLIMWDSSALEHSDSNPAVEMAKKRHAENYGLRAEAIKYWKENIDPNLSAEKAADKLIGIVPLSHKKLAEVVAAERKKKP
jgi:hypothetical protein